MGRIQKILFSIGFWPLGLYAQTTVFVSPKGNDTNPGTQANPFSSIDKALSVAKKKPAPVVMSLHKPGESEVASFWGAKVKKLVTPGERSATGMPDLRGVLVLGVEAGSRASWFLQTNDVIWSFNNRPVKSVRELQEASLSVTGSNTELVILRNQTEVKRKLNYRI